MQNRKKVSLHTLGCRLNQAETAIIAADLQKKGFELVPFGQSSDVTVINTCTVTEQADSKCRQAVRKSIRNNPDTYVAVVGCYAQMGVEAIRKIDGVDLIVGNEHKMQLASLFDDNLVKEIQPRVVHAPKISREVFTIDSVGLFDTHTRANLKIQDGCSFVCSFCIIATARGPARSREFKDILREARELSAMGFKEIVLTGVNIGTYRQDGKSFLELLMALEEIEGVQRIRISSIEPTTIGHALIDYMAGSSKLCRHLHIPLQSGDDRILESMRRKHTVAEFSEIVNYAHQKIDGLNIGTDVMVGYPTESAHEFTNTKKLLADLPVAYFHVFNYSDRKGTTAYNLKPKVPHAVRKERAATMQEVGLRKKAAFNRRFIGQTINVLFEEKLGDFWVGWTDNYLRVKSKAPENMKNQLRPVKLTAVQGEDLIGDLV